MRMFLLLTALLLVGCETIADLPPEERKVQMVHEVPMADKATLYVRALEWVSSSFRSSKAVIDMQDKDAGIIVAKGIIPNGAHDAFGVRYDVRITIKLEIKDGRYRATYDTFTMIFGHAGEREASPGTEHDSCRETARKLDAELAAFMTTGKKDF